MKRKRLEVTEIPVPARFKHPLPPNELLPRHEFTYILFNKYGSNRY